tara:strand:+ start:408 stop:737 length:330 start_codon:yes stop_codon:yes gene_type:complete
MSDLEKYDTNQNGVIDPHELAVIELEDRRRKMEDEDAQRDSIRKMAWFALFGLLMYPSGIFICDLLGLGRAAELIADIAGTYFIAVSALVASFFGFSSYQATKEKKGSG